MYHALRCPCLKFIFKVRDHNRKVKSSFSPLFLSCTVGMDACCFAEKYKFLRFCSITKFCKISLMTIFWNLYTRSDHKGDWYLLCFSTHDITYFPSLYEIVWLNFQCFLGAKLFKCVRCPSAYHVGEFCIAAGSLNLPGYNIVCPKHFKRSKSNKAVHSHVNVSWCFSCNNGKSI